MLGQLKYAGYIGRLHRGFTLVELMVTLAILALLASLAVPSYRSFLVNQQLSSASSDFLVSMMQARSEAIRLGKSVSMFPAHGTTWASGWYLVEVNNSCEETGTRFGIAQPLGPMVSINSAGTTTPFKATTPSFTYSATGFPNQSCSVLATTGESTLVFEALETGRKRQVSVSNSGRARICDPNSSSC